MAKNEPRMADTYEIETSFYLNGKEIVFGADEKAELRYMVGFCSINPIFGFEQYHDCIGTNNYAEAIQEFGQRIKAEAELALEIQKERGIFDTLTIDDCIPGSRNGDYEGELVVIRADILQRDKQTADYQLCRATGGFGCKASAGGRAVFCQTVYDNREMRYDRTDVLGVIKPERIPDWAKERIAAKVQKMSRVELDSKGR